MEIVPWLAHDKESSWMVLLGPLRDGLAMSIWDSLIFAMIVIAIGSIVFAIIWRPFRNVSKSSIFSFSIGVAWSVVGLFLNPNICCR